MHVLFRFHISMFCTGFFISEWRKKPSCFAAGLFFLLYFFLTPLHTFTVCFAAKNDKPLVFGKYERECSPFEQLHINTCAYKDLFNTLIKWFYYSCYVFTTVSLFQCHTFKSFLSYSNHLTAEYNSSGHTGGARTRART